MTFRRLLVRNLQYHARSHLAVGLGVAVACAVLTGAFLVGDAQRETLRRQADRQRAGVDAALLRPRFFLATPDPNVVNFNTCIFLSGSIQTPKASVNRRVGQVSFIAGWDPSVLAGEPALTELPAMPRSLARQLGLQIGDEFTARISVPSTIPSESLLGRKELEQTTLELTMRLAAILDDERSASHWRLQPGFEPPRNVFLPEEELRTRLAPYALHRATSERPPRMLGHNLILAQGEATTASESLRERLTRTDFDLKWGRHPFFDEPDLRSGHKSISLAEARRLFVPKVAEAMDRNGDGTLQTEEIREWYTRFGWISLESETGILEPDLTAAALRTAEQMGVPAAATFVYVANEIRSADRSIPYSLVAAVDAGRDEPLGPFLPPGTTELADDEIVLTDWPESPLTSLPRGSPIEIRYFRPELEDGRFVEESATFRLAGYLPLAGVALNPEIAPAFPGVTDRLSVRDWQPPFPYDNTRMKAADENYWRQYRTVPKAYITLAAGRRLWASRHGDTTSVRLGVPNIERVVEFRKEYEARLVAELRKTGPGFQFDDVKSRFSRASVGGQDFGLLFLGFSIYLIVAALLLVAMISRLNLERRAWEIGLLQATGWPLQYVRAVLLMEGLLVTLAGGLFGLIAAVLYAESMLELLRQIWPDSRAGSSLSLDVRMTSLTVGFFAIVTVGLGTIHWATTGLSRQSPVRLLSGATGLSEPETSCGNRRLPLQWITLALIASGAIPALFAGSLKNPMLRAGLFFVAGLAWLTGLILGFWQWLRWDKPSSRLGRGWWAVVRLGIRNARRYPSRSLSVCGLLAVASFLLMAVESFRRQPDQDFHDIHGGSGGFPLIVETSLPVLADWSRADADEIVENLQQSFQRRPGSGTPTERIDAVRPLLQQTVIFSLRKSAGEDASCLNLYQAQRPRILGVPDKLIQRGGFRVIESLAKTPAEKANPWLLLHSEDELDVIPVIGEQNTLTWMLKRGLGDEMTIPDESGNERRLRIVAIVKDSPFQSELVTSSRHFRRLFPNRAGFTYHLVSCPPESVEAVIDLLSEGMRPYEPELTRTADRVAAYMAVENTYLTTFQLLGGIGFVLGALGLAVIMHRGIWERRTELALLRALGYRHRRLSTLVLAENVWLLCCGLLFGVVSALISVLPHLVFGGAIPWDRIAVILGLVLLTAMATGWFTIGSALRQPLLAALRNK